MDHKKHLKALLQNYLKGCGDTIDQKRLFWGYVVGWVPEPEAPRVFEEQGLLFQGNEKKQLYTSYRELRKDRQTEHLDDRQLNQKLSGLIVEVLEGKEEYKDSVKLTKRMDEFLAEIIKPEEDYRVMFRVINLDVKIEETQFWDCSLANYNREQLLSWGFDATKRVPMGVEAFEDRTVITVTEKGNNLGEIVKRARFDATRRLRILQNYLKEELIHDQQLFFELSKEFVVRNEATGKIVRWGIDNTNSPIKYNYAEYLVEHVGRANDDFERIKKFHPKLQDRISRTLHWIGLSISEVDPDLKISYLCTALETLLTTKADRLKGEKIAYRGYLLAEVVGAEIYSMPERVLAVYEKRSTVVHGSDISIAYTKDYWLMLEFAQTTLENYMKFVGDHNLGKPTQIVSELLKKGPVTPLLEWLETFDDEYSKSIAESLREDSGGQIA
jgi:hypothetical protein